jgi:hypothetical protein
VLDEGGDAVSTTPCGLTIISRRARLTHVMTCPDPRCCHAGADELNAAAAFRRLGSQIDVPTLVALRIIEEGDHACDRS